MQVVDLKGLRLSIQQARLWSLQKNSLAYRTQCAIMLDGSLHIERFVKALQRVVERHEILRTVFHLLPGTDIPIQAIHDESTCVCPVVDIENLHAQYQRMQIDELTADLQQ